MFKKARRLSASGSITGPGPPIQSRSAPLPRIRGSTLPSHPTRSSSIQSTPPRESARATSSSPPLRAPRSSSVVREEVRPRRNNNNNNNNNPPARSSSFGSRSCSRLQAPAPSTQATRTMSEIDSIFGIDGGDVDAGKCLVSGRGPFGSGERCDVCRRTARRVARSCHGNASHTGWLIDRVRPHFSHTDLSILDALCAMDGTDIAAAAAASIGQDDSEDDDEESYDGDGQPRKKRARRTRTELNEIEKQRCVRG